jgi:hypothetical protein
LKKKINFTTIGLSLLAFSVILVVIMTIVHLLLANSVIDFEFPVALANLIPWSFNLGIICLLISNFSKIKYYYVNKINRRFRYYKHSEKNDYNKKKG